MAQAQMARAPWPVTTVVSCLPVLVLTMGTALAHMLRADAEAADAPDSQTGQPAVLRPVSWFPENQDGPDRRRSEADRDRSARRDHNGPEPGPRHGLWGHGSWLASRAVAGRSGPRGRPEAGRSGEAGSRRALPSGGVTGSNEALNAWRACSAPSWQGTPAAGDPPRLPRCARPSRARSRRNLFRAAVRTRPCGPFQVRVNTSRSEPP
jgi:hypothetical protein